MTRALFEPIAIGDLVLPNRVVMSPMTRGKSPGRVPGEDVAGYYRRRAEGGVGLIVTEGLAIDDPASVDAGAVPALYGEAALKGWRRVTDEVHAAGGLILPQLWHQGVLRNPAAAERPDVPARRPSGVWGTPGQYSLNEDYVRQMQAPTRPMTEEEIADVIASYARAARAAKDAGFDGIAVHAAHGYLIDTFFWKDTNRRTDRWGGDMKARARFGAEVVRAIRKEIGQGPPIMVRYSHHKMQDYNAKVADTPRELEVMLGELVDAGADAFDCSARRFDLAAYPEVSPMSMAGWAKKLSGKPSMAVGQVGLSNWMRETIADSKPTEAVNNLDEVGAFIARGEFDLVAVGRALLNDPDWTRRARNGEPFLPFDRANLGRLN
jgi:2,4-dienoyl-CoA reductase-like NADH-dependent reductase (Old Yellow Enzyme family)